MAENLQLSPFDQSFPPIISKRSPTTRDRAELGTIWINTVLNDVFILTSVVAGVSTWINAGGGSGTFSSLNISGASVFGGAITASTFTAGVVLSSATGVLSSSAGTNGQLLIAKTGLVPAWSTLTAGAGIGIVEGVGTITISAPGATAVSYVTDVAGPVLPDGLGAVNVVGGSNLTSDGTVANTITIDLNPSVSVTGKLTAGNDLEMTTGTCLIASDDNAAQAIYLHANGGVNETIEIYSQLGTSATSLNLHSLVGGITIGAGTALALTGTASSSITMTNAAFAIATGTGALNLGTDAAAKTVTLGSTTGAASTVVQGGTGGIAINAAGIVTMLPATDSQAGAAVTINANVGVGTFTGLTTAAAASQVFTITNSLCTATSAILCTLANLGANDAQMTVQRVVPGAGSFTVTAKNNGAAALNGDVIITFWIIKAS